MEARIVNPEVFRDKRGSFHEVFNMSKEPWNELRFQQQNVSINHRNVWRGLHYQHQHPQGKLVRVLRGAVIDYIVDLRRSSPWFGLIRRFHLTEDDNTMLWVPGHYAHGFFAIEPETIFTYNVFGSPYNKDDEYSIRPWDFPEITQDFDYYGHTKDGYPIIMSDKDKEGLHFDEAPTYG